MKTKDIARPTCALFDGLSNAEYQYLAVKLCAREIALTAGETLFREDSPSNQIGIVLTGSLQIERMRVDGKCIIIEIVGANNSFGAAYAFTGPSTFGVNIRAIESSRVLIFKSDMITSKLDNDPTLYSKFFKNVLKVVSSKVFSLTRQLRIITQRTTADKILTYLQFCASQAKSFEFDIPLDRQSLADYLCVDRCALSSEISKLREKGVLEFKRKHFKLCHQSFS